MRKLLIISVAICFIMLLAACSIPIGDGELTISSDGIDFIGGAEEATTETIETESDTEAEDIDTEEIDEQAVGDDDGAIPEGVDVADLDPLAQGNCAKVDHSRILEAIDFEFYIPECAEIVTQSFDGKDVSVRLFLNGANWEDVAAVYRDYFSNSTFNVKEEEDFRHNYSKFRFKVDEEYFHTSNVNINDSDEGTDIYIELYYE